MLLGNNGNNQVLNFTFCSFYGRDNNVGMREREREREFDKVLNFTTELSFDLLTLDQGPISGLL
jgi:hypothetical protein